MNCSHCNVPMPRDPNGYEIPAGWTVVRIEKQNHLTITNTYLYLCQNCMITTLSRQPTLEHT
jgi:hypothetical protein